MHHERYATTMSVQKLWQVEQHGECKKQNGQGDDHLYCNRRVSFSRGQFFDAIWNRGRTALFLQIGTTVFAHAGITQRTLDLLHSGMQPEEMRQWVREYMVTGSQQADLPPGISDVFETGSNGPNSRQGNVAAGAGLFGQQALWTAGD
jgi:hypothetical protein